MGMERRERASVLPRMAKKEEMARGIVRGVLEQVDTIHMVRAIILDEVDRLDGWMVAKDSLETALGMTWNLIQAGVIWSEISAKPGIQNIILAKIKTQRD